MAKRILYCGLEAPEIDDGIVTHLPLIQTIPYTHSEVAHAFHNIHNATHLILTSPRAALYAYRFADDFGVRERFLSLPCLSVGSTTSAAAQRIGISTVHEAPLAMQEGIISLLDTHISATSHFFWPHAAGARTLLLHELERRSPCTAVAIYHTVTKAPSLQIDLNDFDEIHLTSPSCVRAFMECFGPPPPHARLVAKGPITEKALVDKAQCHGTYLEPAAE